jgi:hypothetical protein
MGIFRISVNCLKSFKINMNCEGNIHEFIEGFSKNNYPIILKAFPDTFSIRCSAGVDGELSRGSSMHTPVSEDPN